MPLTRATKNTKTTGAMSQIRSQITSKTTTSMAVKRKPDGRKVLGDATNKSVGLSRRKPNLALKRSATGDACVKKFQTISKDAKQRPVEEDSRPKFQGHAEFTFVPLDVWRLEMREELIAKGKFHDQELINKENHIESPDFSLGIFEYMKWREERFPVNEYLTPASSGSMQSFKQTGFNERDRKMLIDWMVEFQEIQETTHETLYLAVRLCDYYFGQRQVSREKLQLFAFVGYLLASKFEERWPPTFEDMIYLSEDSYTRDDFIKAELDMLKVLDFDINIPISYRYLRRYAKCIGMDMKAMTVARFYLELTLQEYQFVGEQQSKLAAAALWITLSTLGYVSETRSRSQSPVRHTKKYWCDLLSFYTGVHEWEIIDLAKRMAQAAREVQEECASLQNDFDDDQANDKVCKVIYNKYASETFFMVARERIPTVEEISIHVRRCESERIDFEVVQEPQVKRQSFGSEVRRTNSRLRKMTLRSSTTPPHMADENDKEN